MRRKLLQTLILLLMFAQISFSQTVKPDKKDEISPELKKEAVAFLRETAAEAANLRTAENRISFASEIAGLMWFADEKEARSMYQIVINDFSQLLAQYDAQTNASDSVADENIPYEPPLGVRGNTSRKVIKAISVRQQIASSLAEHDAQLALEFFTASGQVITNPKFRKQLDEMDKYFETRLLAQIAAQDVDTALKYGRKNLAKGFNYELVNVLKKIYEKDADKGAAFGEDIVQKLKSDNSSIEGYYPLSSLLSLGAENLEKIKGKPDKKPIFSEQSMREIADLLAQQILKNSEGGNPETSAYISQIEKFSPASAAQIRQKFSIRKQTQIIMRSGIAVSAPSPAPPPAPLKISTEQNAQKQLMESLQNLGTKQLSKEEREKIVGQARKTIASIKDPNQKMFALSALALQVKTLGDKELAVQIMDEAGSSVNLQPKNYVEFMQIWMLAGGYAQIDANKAFPLLEDAIFRLNDTISAFIKVGEFIDVGGDIIEDGEVQVGGFGGAMKTDLLRSLGGADETVRSLAKADFARTKDLTNKFERTEVRILAKMIVLRVLFNDKKETAEKEE